MSARVLVGDVLERLADLPDASVQTVVTSPPYWGLRDYGAEGQIGLEPTPEAYVERMVEVFRGVRRVLRDDGTVWLNLGDSYAGSGPSGASYQSETTKRRAEGDGTDGAFRVSKRLADRGLTYAEKKPVPPPGLKPKDLVGIPWRVAFALQADGWYLRSDIIWSKPNPMPESVTDRPTKAHEMLFLLAKSPRYFFDADAVREGVGEPRVVESTNGHRQPLVFGQHLGLENAGASNAAVGVRLAATILHLAQRQDDLGLLPLDAEVRQQIPQDRSGATVVDVPVVRRAAAEAARFADGDVSAKEFLGEMHRLCVALPDGDDLKEAWRSATVAVDSDGDGAVRVDDASEIGQVQRVHVGQSKPQVRRAKVPDGWDQGAGGHGTIHRDGRTEATYQEAELKPGRNPRSVWNIATEPFPGAHFATFPKKLVEPCVKAGTSERGCCAECGAPWTRQVDVEPMKFRPSARHVFKREAGNVTAEGLRTTLNGTLEEAAKRTTTGWNPTCDHPEQTVPCTVLDPFCGSGTVGVVALRLGRSFVGIELNPEYAEVARNRITDDAPLFNVVEVIVTALSPQGTTPEEGEAP
jgi:DNA modification methylase